MNPAMENGAFCEFSTCQRHGKILAASRVRDQREAMLATDEVGRAVAVVSLERKDSNLEYM
jgi:hypothetical protein